MMLFTLLSTLTVSALCLTFNNHRGIRQCQEGCRRNWGCIYVEFNANHFLCILKMDSSEKISIIAPFVHWLRTECRICKKLDTCSGKEKKLRVSVENRSPSAGKPENLCAVGLFQQIKHRTRGVKQGYAYGNIRFNLHFLKRDLTVTASFTIPKTDFFYWAVDISFNSYHSSPGRYAVLTSNIQRNEKEIHAAVNLVVIEYPNTILVEGKKLQQNITVGLLKYRLVFLYHMENKRLVMIVYDIRENAVKKSSNDRYVLDAPDIVSANSGDFLVKQQFKVFKQKKSSVERIYIFLRKLEMSQFPPYVIKQINEFKGGI